MRPGDSRPCIVRTACWLPCGMRRRSPSCHCAGWRPRCACRRRVAAASCISCISDSLARAPTCRRSLAGQFAGIPGIVSLSGGFPPPTLFPFAGLTLHLKGGGSVDIAEPSAVSCRLLRRCFRTHVWSSTGSAHAAEDGMKAAHGQRRSSAEPGLDGPWPSRSQVPSSQRHSLAPPAGHLRTAVQLQPARARPAAGLGGGAHGGDARAAAGGAPPSAHHKRGQSHAGGALIRSLNSSSNSAAAAPARVAGAPVMAWQGGLPGWNASALPLGPSWCTAACPAGARSPALLPCLPSQPHPSSLVCRCPPLPLQMIFALFMDRGDSLLLEEYSYPVVTGGHSFHRQQCLQGAWGGGARRRRAAPWEALLHGYGRCCSTNDQPPDQPPAPPQPACKLPACTAFARPILSSAAPPRPRPCPRCRREPGAAQGPARDPRAD